MLVISAREFRENQKSYLDKVQEGLELLVTRGKNQSFKVTKVVEEDTIVSKEFIEAFERGLKDVKEGRIADSKEVLNKLDRYLKSYGI